MEPMVLLGLIAVAYGGYVAWLDLRQDVSYRVAIKMMSRRQGEGDAGVVKYYVEEPTTKPTNSAFDCNSVSARFPLRAARRDGRTKTGKRRLQSPIKKMAGVYV